MEIPRLSELLKGKDKKEVIVALVFALGCLLYVFGALPPQFGMVSNMSGEIKKLKADLNEARADIGERPSYKIALEESRGKYRYYQALALAHEQEIPALLEMLSGMARESGVKIAGIKPLRGRESFVEVAGSIYKEIPVQIIAKSGYHELGEFLERMEKAKKFVNIKDIRIESNASSIKKHDVELLISAYLVAGEG